MLQRIGLFFACCLLAACATQETRPAADSPACTDGSPVARLLHQHYASWRGARHRLGGLGRNGIDCSGFVFVTFQELFGKTLPRTTAAQGRMGQPVHRHELTAGDLVFFKTGWRKRHVGIYLGNDRFVHASYTQGIVASPIDAPYWRRHYWKARRIL